MSELPVNGKERPRANWRRAVMESGMAVIGSNWTAVTPFLAPVAGTLAITWWALRRTRSAKDFYAVGGNMSGLQNGLAIAGDRASFAGSTPVPQVISDRGV